MATTNKPKLRIIEPQLTPEQRGTHAAIRNVTALREVSEQLRAMRTTCAERLTTLRTPALHLCTALGSAQQLIARTYAKLDLRAQQIAPDVRRAATQVAGERMMTIEVESLREQQSLRGQFERDFVKGAAWRLADQVIGEGRASVERVIADVYGAARDLEDAAAVLSLESTPIGAALEKADLATLLRRQQLATELEGYTASQLLQFWRDLVRLDEPRAAELAPTLLRRARTLKDPSYFREQFRGQPRKGVSKLPETLTGEQRAAAAQLVYLLEQHRLLTSSPDLAAMNEELRPQFAILIKRTIGVDVRDLDAPAFQSFAQRFANVTRLDLLPYRLDWPSRVWLAQDGIAPRVTPALLEQWDPSAPDPSAE